MRDMNKSPKTIHCFNQLNADRKNDTNPLGGQYALRYEVLKALNWNVFFEETQKIEFDEYDLPTTQYFTHFDPQYKKVTACARLCRTDISFPQRSGKLTYMLKDHFSHAVDGDLSAYSTPQYREGSRLCVSRDYSPEERAETIQSLLLGIMTYCVQENILGLLGIMPPKVTYRTWGRLGLEPEVLGPTISFSDNDNAQARLNRIDKNVYQNAILRSDVPPPKMVYEKMAYEKV